MLYSLYELNQMALAPWRAAAMAQTALLRSPLNPAAGTDIVRNALAAGEVFESVTRRYLKPEWGIHSCASKSLSSIGRHQPPQ